MFCNTLLFIIKTNKPEQMSNTHDENTTIDCSICMDILNPNLNYIITECGHQFHSRCLLTNISRNGFGCPNCRTNMIDENMVNNTNNEENLNSGFFIDDEEDDVDSWHPPNDDDDDIEERNDYALRGMRMLFALNEGDEIEESLLDQEGEGLVQSDIAFILENINYLINSPY